nr:MAG TPA: hypothetical protein [Caudoviricetes sp.]
MDISYFYFAIRYSDSNYRKTKGKEKKAWLL